MNPLKSDDQELIKKYMTRILSEPIFRMEQMINIVSKDGTSIKYKPWDSQKTFVKYMNRTNMVIKIRRQGSTIGRLAHGLSDARVFENRNMLILNKDDNDNTTLFNSVKFMDKFLPKHFQGEKYKNDSKTIHYKDTNSQIQIQTAGATIAQSANKARGTNINELLITEAGYIKHLSPLLQGAAGTVPESGRITLESTSSGPRGVFSQMCLRAMSQGKQIEQNVWTLEDHSFFFFGFISHPEYLRPIQGAFDCQDEEEERLMTLGASPEKINWRRWKMREFAEDVNSASRLNPAQQFKMEYPATIDDAFEESGGAFFDRKIIVSVRDYVKATEPDPLTIGLMRSPSGEPIITPPVGANRFTIYRPPVTGWEARYFAFWDVGQGGAQSDFDVCYVADLLTKTIVAKYHGRYGASAGTPNVINLCNWYGNAHLAWDATGIGAEVSSHIIHHGYTNVYKRQQDENPMYMGVHWGAGGRGYLKSFALGIMKTCIQNRLWTIPDQALFEETEYFQRQTDDAINPEANPGFHDDHIMACAGLLLLADKVPQPRKTENISDFQTKKQAVFKSALNAAKREYFDSKRETVTNWS